MLFIPGKTKLTGLISSMDDKFSLNSGIWTPVDDIKLAWASISLTASSATIKKSDGIDTIDFDAAGRFTVYYTSQFDQVPVCLAQCVLSSAEVASRQFAMVDDGTQADAERAVGQQTFYVVANGGAALITGSATVNIFAIGIDANSTNITDNSDQTPLTAQSLNRIIAIGNYKNPESLENTVPVISAGYTSTTVNAGDTLVDASGINVADANHTRQDTGDYDTDFTSAYMVTPLAAMVTCIGDYDAVDVGYGVSTTTTQTLTVYTTDGTDNTNADKNYCFMVIGMMEVA